MSKHTIELSRKGVGGADEDWWKLVFDSSSNEFYVLHTWEHMSIRNFRHDSGEKKIAVDDFLADPESLGAHTKLVSLLKGLFKAAKDG